MSKMNGFTPVYVDTEECGRITASNVEKVLTDQTALVSLMHVNNELGCINEIKEIASLCRAHNIPIHSDTVQSLGKLSVDVKELGLDFLSGSAHKIYGPKGIGIMYVRNGSRWIPWMTGGSQERSRRGGTINVPGVIGFAKALELAVNEMEENTKRFKNLRALLLSLLDEKLTSCTYSVNGTSQNKVPHIINLSFTDDAGHGIDGEMLLLNLDIEGICVSNGSACTSGAVEPSHVLLGLGVNEKDAKSSIRVSFGKKNTEEDVQFFVEKLDSVLTRMFDLVQ